MRSPSSRGAGERSGPRGRRKHCWPVPAGAGCCWSTPWRRRDWPWAPPPRTRCSPRCSGPRTTSPPTLGLHSTSWGPGRGIWWSPTSDPMTWQGSPHESRWRRRPSRCCWPYCCAHAEHGSQPSGRPSVSVRPTPRHAMAVNGGPHRPPRWPRPPVYSPTVAPSICGWWRTAWAGRRPPQPALRSLRQLACTRWTPPKHGRCCAAASCWCRPPRSARSGTAPRTAMGAGSSRIGPASPTRHTPLDARASHRGAGDG